MRTADTFRWALVVPSAVLAWYVAVFFGVLFSAFVVAPCSDSDAPPPQFCEAAWFVPVRLGVVPFWVGVSAIMVVTVSALVAPSHRAAVAWLAAGIGTAVALVMGYSAEAFFEAVVAIACGVLAAVVVGRVVRGSRAKVARVHAVSDA
jgi:hypothetical protein